MKISKEDLRKYPCNICKKRFKASHHLRDHMALHSGKVNYKCAKCNQEFIAPGAFRAHVRTKHGFECPVCKKIFDQLTKLREHQYYSKHHSQSDIMTDSKVDVSQDDVDPEDGDILVEMKPSRNRATQESNKIQISSTRTVAQRKPVVKPKLTPVANTPVKKILKRSRRTAFYSMKTSRNNKFSCKVCGIKYNMGRNLNRHMNTAHRESFKFTCEYCEYQTNRSDNFNIHLKRHSEVTIKCLISSCKLVFFSKKCLQMHMNKIHGKGSRIKREKIIDEEVEDNGEFEDEDDERNGTTDDSNHYDKFSHENSFLNSTEKSVDNNLRSRQTRSSTKPNHTATKSGAASSQLKISTCVSLGSAKNGKTVKSEKPKPSENSVRYECCECEIDFDNNTDLWEHLMAKHLNKLKNKNKK